VLFATIPILLFVPAGTVRFVPARGLLFVTFVDMAFRFVLSLVFLFGRSGRRLRIAALAALGYTKAGCRMAWSCRSGGNAGRGQRAAGEDHRPRQAPA
jgi:hypothetical protein